ncbi:MAG: phenylalanine--tRNA ligase subunit beta [bacterium]
MKVSLNWLKTYIDYDCSPAQLAEKLTMAGLEVENITSGGTVFKNIIVGDIAKVKNHPNADKLKICTVDIGNKKVSVICGAKNVRDTQRVPVAVTGSILADGTEIKHVKLRGVTSEGMICSERELGISDNHEGIMVLPKSEYRVGEEFIKNSYHDTIFDIDVTPNRPDCLSHIGVAREIGVIVNNKLKKPTVSLKESKNSALKSIKIHIHDITACPRYSARVIRNVVIKDSPQWLKNYLKSVGIRSINNVVDITNYVLMETGHPLHAFDYDLIENSEIHVRKASPQEKFTTLDDVERSLDENDLLICDGEKGVALAGVMGGYNSEISRETKNILLESAYFDPYTIRKTSKKFALFTESSQRFERGADPNNTIYAVDRASQLLQELAHGSVEKDVVDIYPQKIECVEIKLRFSRINQLIGQEIPKDIILRILKGLELTIIEQKEKHIKLQIPTFRPDLNRECDLIEEIARHYGYNNIKSNMYSNIALSYTKDEYYDDIETVRDYFVGQGFFEIISHTLVPKKHIEIFDNQNVVQLENPLSPETTFLRNSSIPSMLDTIQWNINRSQNNLRFFEIGRKFISQKKTLPIEKTDIICALTGFKKRIPLWNNEENNNVDFYQLKGTIESFFDYFHIQDYSFTVHKIPFFATNYSYAIEINQKISGHMGKISSEIQKKWDFKQAVYLFELDFKNFRQCIDKQLMYSPIPKFPPIIRDLSVIIDKKILSEDIQQYIVNKGGKYLKQAEIFDIYRGEGIPNGKKSITFNLKFLSEKRTLTENEIDPIFDELVRALKNKFSASLRT